MCYVTVTLWCMISSRTAVEPQSNRSRIVQVTNTLVYLPWSVRIRWSASCVIQTAWSLRWSADWCVPMLLGPQLPQLASPSRWSPTERARRAAPSSASTTCDRESPTPRDDCFCNMFNVSLETFSVRSSLSPRSACLGFV